MRVLLAFILGLILLPVRAAPPAPAPLAMPNASAAPSPKRVFLITNRGCEDICGSFRHALEAQGPVEFIWRDADGDTARVAGFVTEARQLKPDLVATWGTNITLAAIGPLDAIDPVRHLTDIPVVYMYVGNPVGSKIARDSKQSGRPNVAGANTSVPLDAQINLLGSYRKLRRIGMLYNTDEAAAVGLATSARKAFEARGIHVTEVALVPGKDGKPNAADIPDALKRLAATQPDFLYYVGSTFTLAQIGLLSAGAVEHGLPLFTSTEPAYRAGEVLLGLITPQASIGQAAAHQAAQILFHGKRPGELPTLTVTRYSVLINMRVARALKRYPPMQLLQFAEISD